MKGHKLGHLSYKMPEFPCWCQVNICTRWWNFWMLLPKPWIFSSCSLDAREELHRQLKWDITSYAKFGYGSLTITT